MDNYLFLKQSKGLQILYNFQKYHEHFLAQTLRKLQYLKRWFYPKKRCVAALNDETAKYMYRTWPDNRVVVCDFQKYLYHFSSSNIKKVTTFETRIPRMELMPAALKKSLGKKLLRNIKEF